MRNVAECLKKAQYTRELATTARRLASALTLDTDRQRVQQFAKDLEGQAVALEQEAAGSRLA
jgi:hypothetical protein